MTLGHPALSTDERREAMTAAEQSHGANTVPLLDLWLLVWTFLAHGPASPAEVHEVKRGPTQV